VEHTEALRRTATFSLPHRVPMAKNFRLIFHSSAKCFPGNALFRRGRYAGKSFAKT
jgi:hypothetical protein